jgi:hypothetical protein
MILDLACFRIGRATLIISKAGFDKLFVIVCGNLPHLCVKYNEIFTSLRFERTLLLFYTDPKRLILEELIKSTY